MSLDQALIDVVKQGLDEYLAPYTARLRDPEPLTYTFPAAAKVIGTSRNTVARLVKEGHLTVVPHMGHRNLIPRRQVLDFINESVASMEDYS